MSSMTTSPSIPLFEEVVNGFNKLSVSGGTRQESSDLRRARQLAFDKFRELGFPSIRDEDWRYTNLARFLKDEFTIEGWEAPGKAVRLFGLVIELAECRQSEGKTAG